MWHTTLCLSVLPPLSFPNLCSMFLPLFILCRPLSLSQHFPLEVKLKKKNLPLGNESLCPAIAFLPIYFCRVTLQRQHPLFYFAVFVFSSLICSFLHLFSSRAVAPPLLWKYVWQKKNIQPWGYIASFMWGPVVTLKACYVVCRFASVQLLLSVLGTLVCARFSTWSLPGWKALVGREAARPRLPALLCARMWLV